jgi:hypothetical protein
MAIVASAPATGASQKCDRPDKAGKNSRMKTGEKKAGITLIEFLK